MKYETQMKFDKHTITEDYVVGKTTYGASLAIQSPGFCSGMAGYEAHTVGVSLFVEGSDASVGYVGISFPRFKRCDGSNTHQMLEPCSEKGETPAGRKFTPYAEGVIEALVTEFIRQREASRSLGFSLHSISVSVGEHQRERVVTR